MRRALLLVDLQRDFLARPGLVPSPEEFSAPLAALLEHARTRDMPVLHVHTRVDAGGNDRMPHWQRDGIWECVAGTSGAQSPAPFAPRGAEPVFHKQFYSGFANPGLHSALTALQVEEVWIAGLYTHGCVRATALDAYERGYRVVLVEDCVASFDPQHAAMTLDYLDGRAATLRLAAELAAAQGDALPSRAAEAAGEVAGGARCTDPREIPAMAAAASEAADHWAARPFTERRAVLQRCVESLRRIESPLLEAMVADLGKPIRLAREELERARGHALEALALENHREIAPGVTVRYEPHGVVAVVTPWNNPVAIAAGKIAAALALGNAVLWKPAPQADAIARRVLAAFVDGGLPAHLLQLVSGGAEQARRLAREERVDALSLTGPEAAGRALAALCLPRGKPLQAELGGNNALLVLADADIEGLAPAWARLAFAFAGQRCTALRRFVVEAGALERFETAMAAALAQLVPGPPDSERCDVGPMIGAVQRERAAQTVSGAVARGARIVATGGAADGLDGHYHPPTLLAGLAADDALVQEESFAPIAVIQLAEDFEHGLALVNGVRQGLLAAIATGSDTLTQAFRRRAQAGIVADGAGLVLHPAAPFGGWKASQIGPPEHGPWDRDFFARVKTCYGSAAS